MLIRVVLVSLLLAMTGGCSVAKWGQKDNGEITLSWYCLKLDDGSQRCEKRRMQSGKPVDQVVHETIVIPNGKAPPPVVQQPFEPAQPRTSEEAVPWSRKPVTAVNALDTADLAVENIGPAPRATKNTVNMWEKLSGQKNGQKAATAPATNVARAQPASPPPVPQPQPEQAQRAPQAKNVAAPRPAPPVQQKPVKTFTGYTVQLAAFTTKAQAETFMANKKYQGLALFGRKILNNGEPWWIVTHGEFSSYAEAENLAKTLATQYAGIEPWARSWTVIQTLEKP